METYAVGLLGEKKNMQAFLLMLHGGSSAGDIIRKSNMSCCQPVRLRSGELQMEKERKGKKRKGGRREGGKGGRKGK